MNTLAIENNETIVFMYDGAPLSSDYYEVSLQIRYVSIHGQVVDVRVAYVRVNLIHQHSHNI